MNICMLGDGFETEDIARRLLAGDHCIYQDTKNSALLGRLGFLGRIKGMEIQEALEQLDAPKVVWNTELSGRQLGAIVERLPAGTILVNSRTQYFADNLKLTARLAKKGSRYVDVGLAMDEYRLALFVGGEQQAFQDVEPLLAALAGDGGYYHCGPAGAGHFLRCMQQKYDAQVQSIFSGIVEEVRQSPFNDEIDVEAFVIFSHLYCKKQPLPNMVWQFLQAQAHSALVVQGQN